METNWEYGPAHLYWAENEEPGYKAWTLAVDTGTIGQELFDLLCFLGKLGIIQYGTVYEQIDMVRIKVRHDD